MYTLNNLGAQKTTGVVEREPGSGIWWIRYTDAEGKRHWEKCGRCNPKRGHRSMKLAESYAAKASERNGELIIAYECPDCGMFHIGHADHAQRLARKAHMDRPCQVCGGVIPSFKKEKATRFGGTALYCSDPCQRAASRTRSEGRKQAKQTLA